MCYYYMNDIKQEGLHAGQFHTVVFGEVKTNISLAITTTTTTDGDNGSQGLRGREG